jgi:hypothetical protein
MPVVNEIGLIPYECKASDNSGFSRDAWFMQNDYRKDRSISFSIVHRRGLKIYA